jgi:hypothetical protein
MLFSFGTILAMILAVNKYRRSYTSVEWGI